LIISMPDLIIYLFVLAVTNSFGLVKVVNRVIVEGQAI
jgi:hypothetical protein